MAEKLISKRLSFPKGLQYKFLNDVQKALSINNGKMASLIGKNARTLADWRREKFSMTFDAAKLLSERSGVPIPLNSEVKEAHWYASRAASVGGRAVYERHGHIGGDEDERKRRWYVWWNTEGRFRKNFFANTTKPIKEPPFSPLLAEFVGIVLGDGGISKRQVVVTLHRHDDKEYSDYVRFLVKKLFQVTPGTYRNKKSAADSIVISRTELVKFCIDKLGLKIGNKVRQQVGVPSWIQNKSSYRIACLRGLVDTDGCVIKHCYVSKGKKYRYKKLSFTNSSTPLLEFVFEALSNLGMNPRVTQNRKEVRIESQSDIKRYFHVIGSNNSKHLNRWAD